MTTTTPLIARNAVERGWIIAVSVLAILLGVIAFLIPRATLLTVAIVFGIYLIASGTFRLVTAFTTARLPGWVRWLTGLLGALILVAGILCLSNPWESLTVLGIVIGLGWIFDGVASIASRSGRTDKRRWLPVTAGIAAIIAGVLAMIMPIIALAAFVTVTAILMILIGVATLFLLSVGPSDTTSSEPDSVPIGEVIADNDTLPESATPGAPGDRQVEPEPRSDTRGA
ncbi:HdeD family acid-resistance protein [Herbiconiux sp. VKM Ac-2851]|uniref:HdeD family acid-resistance protein n=1 Tax=Herbiconiux sp. VKM Ac-2851 TaxID=2739025 RepID=UPI001565F559|nr:DUF308 domain-containing protein [Herbiconiux sp. VKM Ac-2851]NQX37194.1 DUF308 domain-containing protein [Herbiconiux sp. VKM Ac-2851]